LSGLYSIPLMPNVLLALLALPIRLAPRRLLGLAFALWLAGGLLLLLRGGERFWLGASTAGAATSAGALAAAFLAAVLKERAILARSCRRNVERLAGLRGPQRLVRVYGWRSWIVIGLAALAGASLGWLEAPPLWRGAVGIAVGAALVLSSRHYLSALVVVVLALGPVLFAPGTSGARRLPAGVDVGGASAAAADRSEPPAGAAQRLSRSPS
jgi:hypothetical protein